MSPLLLVLLIGAGSLFLVLVAYGLFCRFRIK